jgi:hypothetical protein
MKKRTSHPTGRSPEFKGVVKKITGTLTSRPDLEAEGRAEMLGHRRHFRKRAGPAAKPARLNPDPHRRG